MTKPKRYDYEAKVIACCNLPRRGLKKTLRRLVREAVKAGYVHPTVVTDLDARASEIARRLIP